MFTIGTFARLANVSVRTLRHYEEIDLLKPDAVDGATGYRSYRAQQIPRLHRIVVLRDLGLSLAEIRRTLDAELTHG
jgi:DNA-binding transcriptional MerR regulator